ncbi:ATP-binding protein [Methylobacterium nigriterrae]|uniref:ATP-binding protein n=1 Tax=Methylobacterium nigriterrae TaxID=3127512 RepID=UPI0030134E54
MGARLRAHDWAATPLGPIASWSPSLCTAVRMMLASRFAMWMAWGPDLTFFCNDAYRPTLGVKQTWALGSRSDAVWAEIWPDIGPRIERVLASGEATWDEGLLLFLERSGFPEETYHTFSYSPLADDSGAINGMLCVVSEETERVIGERRLRVLRDLGAGMASARTIRDVGDVVEACLAGGIPDLPFAVSYLLGPDDAAPELLAQAALGSDHPAAADAAATANLARARLGPQAPAPVALADLGPAFAEAPAGPWNRMPGEALILPIPQQGHGRPAGLFVAGLNPYRPLDGIYRGFLDLFVSQIATGLANACAYEQERRRAEALAEIDRQKTLFFSNVSHEFRTPLTLMLGPLEEVIGKPPGGVMPENRRLVEVAHRNGLRLLKLVNALLDFSRIEAGRIQAVFEPTELGAYTAELASSFRSATDKAGLTLDVACPPLPGPAFVDREMWEKIVLNLISNAFKFTFQGSIGVSLTSGERHVRLSVIDTGTGIAAAELPRLFERFHRVEGAQGRSFEGSGIGLALVQELAQLHGGGVQVESTPGRGSAFHVDIPLGSAHLPPDRIRAERTRISTATRSQAFVEEAARWLASEGGDVGIAAARVGEAPAPLSLPASAERVLLADDNADMRDYVRRLLQSQGYTVEAVADGAAALAAARKTAPDLILSDVMMPKLDGFGLLAALRADAALRSVPTILLSARAGEEAQIAGVEAGADDYLTKPFSAREILARVEANLKLARVRRETADALRRMNASLEAQVAERTSERDRMWRLSKDVMLVAGFDGIVQAVNPAWTDLLGWPDAAVVGRSFLGFVHPSDRQRTVSETRRSLEGLSTLRFENRLRHQDGSNRILSWNAVPSGERLHAVGRDVTEQRDLEEAFRQAQKMEAVGQLTGGIAHDFNNLLTGISGSLELLQTRLAQGRVGEVDRYVNAAQGASKRAAALTHRLLAFSRRQTLDPKPTNVNRLVAGMEDLVRRTVGPSIHLEVVAAGGLWDTLADQNQLENALLNLCINARDAMPNGGRLTIETGNRWLDERTSRERDLPAGQYVSLCVSDTGTGMAPDVVKRAFDPFFTTKPIGQGTGLGLSMIYGFARQSGGQARIYSEIDEGTMVCLYLPRHHGRSDDAELPPPASAKPRAEQGQTVLVVDDEPTVRMLVTEALEELGYTAVEAADSVAGLRILESDIRIDLLVTDVGLPGGMNGRQMADAGRVVRPDLRVLFITGYAENAVLGSGHLEPGMQVVTKPFVMDVLTDRIKDLIQDA